MRLLMGIAALTVLCMFAIAVVTDHLADICLSAAPYSQSSRVHLINDVTHAIKSAQACRATYLATGNPAALDAYRAACAEVDSNMDRLVNEDSEVTTKLAHAQGLRHFVHEKLSEIGRILQSKPAALAPSPLAVADDDLARIQKLLDSLGQEESRDISGQLEAGRARTLFHRNLVIALAVINSLFLGGVAFCAIRIRKLHSLITLCAWSKRIQHHDKWVPLEEYMRTQLGVRISHGISKEEYERWSAAELSGDRPPEKTPVAPPRAVQPESPRAAA
jgi:CHASE3 domain sensor protein